MPQIVLTQSDRRVGDRRPVGGGLAHALGRLPPTTLLLLSLVAVQLGSPLATVLFSSLGPAGTAFPSTGFSVGVLTALARPPWVSHCPSGRWPELVLNGLCGGGGRTHMVDSSIEPAAN
jgi:threonine/homoserine efflux transporter RhtA